MNINKKVKIIRADYNKETGISTVTIDSRYGQFTGYARLHPQDADRESVFAGCEYAEIRANIKYMKTRRVESRIKLKTMKEFYVTISSMTGFIKDGIEARKARMLIHEYKKEVQYWTDMIASAEKSLRNKIELRDATVKKLESWTKENN